MILIVICFKYDTNILKNVKNKLNIYRTLINIAWLIVSTHFAFWFIYRILNFKIEYIRFHLLDLYFPCVTIYIILYIYFTCRNHNFRFYSDYFSNCPKIYYHFLLFQHIHYYFYTLPYLHVFEFDDKEFF